MTWFRTYDSAWNRTGWHNERQYSGQSESQWDWPTHCEACGKQDVVAVNLHPNPKRVTHGALPAGVGYAAKCRCGHVMPERLVAELAT